MYVDQVFFITKIERHFYNRFYNQIWQDGLKHSLEQPFW